MVRAPGTRVLGGGVVGILTAALLTPVGAVAAPPPSDPGFGKDAVYDPAAPVTANWTRADALKIEQDASNTKPLIPDDFPVMTDEVWVWDTWPLTNLEMEPVAYKGYNVIFSLVAPRDIPFPERHWVAKIGYFYSKDAVSWTYGGELFPDDAVARGSREWAGSTVLTGRDTVRAFYTASGEDGGGVDPSDVLQRLAYAAGTIYADDSGVFFRGFNDAPTDHVIVAEADGRFYQTLEQSQGGPIIYAFRDPWVFRDPVNGDIYALFEGNNAGAAGSHTCDPWEVGDVPAGHVVPDEARFYTGNIGIARIRADRADASERLWTTWRLLPPLVSGECTNQQLERPHLVVRDGMYYLWTISHDGTFAPGLEGPDGVYGFVGNGLRSDYEPLNGSGLVLGNPPEAPKLAYSSYVMPNLLVESFIDTVPLSGGGVRFGGTLAPTLEIDIEGSRTELVDVLPYGYIPAMASAPPRPW